MPAIRHGRVAPAPLDLFGEVPVSLDDVLLWMLAVPRIPPSSSRFAYYVRFYDVPGKIRAAKLAGTFDATIAPAVDRLSTSAAVPPPAETESAPPRLRRLLPSALPG